MSCDATLYVTSKWFDIHSHGACPACGANLLIVSDTIQPNLTKEEQMETETGVFTTEFLLNKIAEMQADKNEQDTLIKQLEHAKESLYKSVNGYHTKEQWLLDYLINNYDELEQHAQVIADIFGIALTKEVEYDVTITARIVVEVSMDEVDSVEDFISSNVSVDSYTSEMTIMNHEIQDVVEVK
jgi:hypothetical protein